MDFLKELNDVQYAAVTTLEGPVLVVAGPGSGKTRVLTFRIAHIIQSGVPAYKIMALTFTNKAAKSMKERIVSVVGEKATGVWAGTFHSIFSKILRVEAEKLGLPSNFTIYDTDDSKSAIRDIVKTQGLDPKVYTDNSIYSRISLAKNNLISPEEYSMRHDYLQQDKNAKKPYLYKIYQLYVKRCEQSGALDFDDLLFKTHKLFKAFPEVVEKYRKRFPYVLVDEFQDTNQLQYAIVQQLVNYPGSPRNITVVGDDAQSIYAFRGATIQNILDFERDYPDLKTFKLEQNYRSTQPIVQAANMVIAHNRKQLKKTIFTDKIEGEPIRVLKTLSDAEEGRRVADHILEMKTRQHLSNGDIAILYRTNSQSRVFEEALTNYRIPFRVYGGLSFFQRKEIKDIIAYLRLCVNPRDSEALKRVINYPKRGIGDKTVEQLSTLATEKGISMAEVAANAAAFGLAPRAATPIHEFMLLISNFRQKVNSMGAYDFAMHVFRVSGLAAELKQDISLEGISRLENANALLDGIRAYEESLAEQPVEETTEQQEPPVSKIAQYLQNIALLTDMDNEGDGVDDHIKMMSVHSAKGLEFKAVFVVGLEENLFPSFMALQSEDPFNALDEERRLFYVAITRAEKYLTLSFATSRWRNGKMAYNPKSRFLDEIASAGLKTSISEADSGKSSVKAAFGPPSPHMQAKYKPASAPPKPSIPNFKPSPISQIVPGAKVAHERFGVGVVKAVDGVENKVAVIAFDNPAEGEKRIMLKFARLMVMS